MADTESTIIIQSKQAKYRCPKHGYVGSVIGVAIDLTEFKGSFEIHRQYCFYCIVEALDKLCHEVKETNLWQDLNTVLVSPLTLQKNNNAAVTTLSPLTE